ncbi:MAG: 50S ribosomal protein L32 [Gordonia sp. (in: high G+C Gram-positive bacteria)]|uniref:50S ribosomal protein L32 n=1 Tax=Gordonia sp. (in: high G+C Gram-positive bacteria) TaxID=84139 RepID=UPI003BB666DD
MAVPKRRMSRANTRMRRSQWKADNAVLQEEKIDGVAHRIPRRLVKAAKLGLVDLDRR